MASVSPLSCREFRSRVESARGQWASWRAGMYLAPQACSKAPPLYPGGSRVAVPEPATLAVVATKTISKQLLAEAAPALVLLT